MALWSSKKQKNNTVTKLKKPKRSTFHCVEILMSYDACDKVMELHGKRFLSAEAPSLPLKGCSEHCECKFKHHNDRRDEERRDAFNPGSIHFDGLKNRRHGGDRRRSTQTYISVG